MLTVAYVRAQYVVAPQSVYWIHCGQPMGLVQTNRRLELNQHEEHSRTVDQVEKLLIRRQAKCKNRCAPSHEKLIWSSLLLLASCHLREHHKVRMI